MSGKKIRLFVAVDIPGEIRKVIALAVEDLEEELDDARRVKSENLHLTLKFIGSYEEDKLGSLTEEVRTVASRSPRFTAALGGCGAFPSASRARVIWLGVTAGKEEMKKMAQKLDSRLERAGVRREGRPFQGHLTLARLKQLRDCSRYIEVLEQKLEHVLDISFGIHEIVLYQSILSPRGPTYIPLAHIELRSD